MIQQADRAAFLALNVGLANSAFDFIMPIVTNDWFLRAILVLIALALSVFGGNKGRFAAIASLITVGLADLTSSQIIKPLVERVRPCHVISEVHLLVPCSQGHSFPSSHAANTFSIALLLGVLFPKLRWYLFAFAALVSYSRIAVGVHYPGDVIAGAIDGLICGTIVLATWHRFLGHKFPVARKFQSS